MNQTALQNKALAVLLALVTIAFIWILLPYYGAIFWAVILGILFAPLQRHLLLRFGRRRNLAAATTLLVCLLVAILPVIITSALLVQEGAALYQRIEHGELDIAGYVERGKEMLPAFAQQGLDSMGMGNLDGLRDKISKWATQGSQVLASQAFNFGQGTFEFVISFGIMMYLLFFFLREGAEVARQVRLAVPLPEQQKRRLQLKFNRVVRATVKGNVLVAITQGALGGFIFWVLDIPSALVWAVLMAFLSLLPAVGAGIVWAPVAAYFLLTGAILSGVILTAFGVLVIGLVDNLLRPILVGKDTRMPDYLILVSTLGGLAVFGLNGFVIGPLIAALFVSSWAIFAATKPQVQLPE
ncbi:AI-2E family transporter [Pseudomonas inefficax]|jgi:predicted PurR-regulated permease PerM|uniref:AI-2E family transporter n=1 Tax=Pseudomonas inefficax TaxID=2078786 RepID=A0AAQ1P7L7_9PSED|nr:MULTISPECIES: AI-2E family transporter [Pseudomonas]RAM68139.1 membrane protein [Pseudomonas putida]MBT9237784.1 AI-2E family transporter [Pseudomonas sp. MG-2]MCM8914153.1 AI-2E family transporter [Pseudomonas inefficax]MEC4564227.1 AI-2E family transporter [Pseudomonas sp. CMAA1741]WNN38544.1 AI-2E family transporter [Pseudomonas inefficax]